MGGVRLSYALDMWFDLAKNYSPAMDAFIELRNSNKETLLEGKGSFDNFHDLSAFNRTLDEDEDTFNVFLHIHDNFPDQAKSYYNVSEELIIERKRYDICETYLSDPFKKYSKIQHLHEINQRFMSERPEMGQDEEYVSYVHERYVFSVSQLIEVLLALGKISEAEKIKSESLEYYETSEINNIKIF